MQICQLLHAGDEDDNPLTVPHEDVQCLAGHATRRTPQIYDLRRRRVTRNIVERISL